MGDSAQMLFFFLNPLWKMVHNKHARLPFMKSNQKNQWDDIVSINIALNHSWPGANQKWKKKSILNMNMIQRYSSDEADLPTQNKTKNYEQNCTTQQSASLSETQKVDAHHVFFSNIKNVTWETRCGSIKRAVVCSREEKKTKQGSPECYRSSPGISNACVMPVCITYYQP